MESPAVSPEFVTLYRRAFDEYGVQALWNMRRFAEPTVGDTLVVARALRVEGDLRALVLPEEIERVCGATTLNVDSIRYSTDIDIFHDREVLVTSTSLADTRTRLRHARTSRRSNKLLLESH